MLQEGGKIREKKIISIVLALTLVAALIVTPALAAENYIYRSWPCPYCGRCFIHLVEGEEKVYHSYSVDSCDYYSSNYTHVDYKVWGNFLCSACKVEFEGWDRDSAHTFCGASNMWLGIDRVDEVM